MVNTVKLVAPKRRKWTRLTGDSPFPVPIETNTGEAPAEDNWNYFTGILTDDHVVVQHSGDIDCLYRMGFFGKGNLSRNKPEYNREFWTTKQRKQVRSQTHSMYRVVSKRRYLEHEAWKNGSNDRSDIMSDAFIKRKKLHFAHSSDESLPTPPSTPAPCVQTSTNQEEHDENRDNKTLTNVDDMNVPSPVNDETTTVWSVELTTSEDKKPDPWALETQKDSEDFWGVASSSKDEVGKSEETCEDRLSGDQVAAESMDVDTSAKVVSSVNQLEKCPDSDKNTEKESLLRNLNNQEQTNKGSVSNIPLTVSLEGSSHLNKVADSEKNGAKSSDNHKGQNAEVTNAQKEGKRSEPEEDERQSAMVDDRCMVEDEDGDLYVLPDSADEDDGHIEGRTKPKWIPTRKYDPHPVKECLHLTFEEAFFLSYGLGCLVVLDGQRKPMDLEQLWLAFSSKRPNFVRNYIAYHSLRSRGWVPKTGLKYGVDFVAYHKGPAFYHGTYSVLVRSASMADLRDDHDPTNQPFTWSNVMGIDRVTEQVAKEVLVMTVLRPDDLSDDDLKSPLCIPRFKTQEILLNRWVPSKEREKNEFDEWI